MKSNTAMWLLYHKKTVFLGEGVLYAIEYGITF